MSKKIKIFRGDANTSLENSINQWLSEHTDINIINVFQSESMASSGHCIERRITISILYSES